MLIRTHRFHGQKGLNDTYRKGQTLRAGLFNIKYATRDASRPYRVAVAVSKKVSKSAVVRNRIRRRIYEAIRKHADLEGGLDVVISVFQEEIATMPAAQLEHLLLQALAKRRPPLV